ncbi:ABC transporter substrate-binding protein [Frankia tisae]|uniref:ABC transporter substrate-binding protein n=1 Tax=Frankia tisae TaxID=2950104 RepID=UPI0021BDF249|nr:ABC transporter substrate-binding protein [Frankia tisae]
MRSRSAMAALAVGVTLALAACGSSDTTGNTTGKSAPAPAPAGPKGSPVKLMSIVPLTTPATNFPEQAGAAKAAARALNKRGGINGHLVQVDVCDSKNDQAAGEACARKAVNGKYLAVVSAFSTAGGINAILEKGGVPSIGSSGVAGDGSDLTSKISFVYQPASTYSEAACPQLLKDSAKISKLGVVNYDISAASRLGVLAGLGGKAAGVGTQEIKVAPTTSDYAPIVARVTDAGAQGVTTGLAEPSAISLIQAGGNKLSYCNAAGTISDANLVKLGPAAKNFYAVGAFPLFNQSAKYPELTRLQSELDADFAAGDKDAAKNLRHVTSTIGGWLAVQIVEQVGKKVTGDLTAKSLLAQLNQTKGLNVQLVPPLDFTKPNAVPGLTRLFNNTLLGQRWDPAKKTFYATGKTYDGQKILAAGAK